MSCLNIEIMIRNDMSGLGINSSALKIYIICLTGRHLQCSWFHFVFLNLLVNTTSEAFLMFIFTFWMKRWLRLFRSFYFFWWQQYLQPVSKHFILYIWRSKLYEELTRFSSANYTCTFIRWYRVKFSNYFSRSYLTSL